MPSLVCRCTIRLTRGLIWLRPDKGSSSLFFAIANSQIRDIVTEAILYPGRIAEIYPKVFYLAELLALVYKNVLTGAIVRSSFTHRPLVRTDFILK